MALPSVIAGAVTVARTVSHVGARSATPAVTQGAARATQRGCGNLLQGTARAPASAKQQAGATSLRRQQSQPEARLKTETGPAQRRRHSTGEKESLPADSWPLNKPPARRHLVDGAPAATPRPAAPTRRHTLDGAEAGTQKPVLPERRHSLDGAPASAAKPAAPARRHSLDTSPPPAARPPRHEGISTDSLTDWSSNMLQLIDLVAERHATKLSADEKSKLEAKQAQRQRLEQDSAEVRPPASASTPPAAAGVQAANGAAPPPPPGVPATQPANAASSQPAAPDTQLNRLSLNAGRLNVNASPALQPLLEQTLAKADQRYRWHASSDAHHHVLLDHHGRLLNLQDSPLAFTAVAHSQPVASGHQPRLDSAGQRVALHHNGTLTHRPLPDQAVQSLLTGIYSHQGVNGAQSEHLRLHENRLHRFDAAHQRWEPMHDVDDKTFDKLSRQGNNQLYAIQGDKRLHNLSQQQKSLMFNDKIAAFSAGAQGELAVVLKDKESHAQQLQLMSGINAPDWQSPTLKIKQSVNGQSGDFHLGGIALHHNQILAIDPNGKLFSAARPGNDAREVNFTEDSRNQAIVNAFGTGAQITALHSNGQGELHAVVKDRLDNEHSCRLDSQGVTPGWNLSESMVMDYQKGLRRKAPLPHAVVDSGRLGKLALMDGKVHFYDTTAQRWEPTSEKADRLIRGNDGLPLKIEGGEVKPLKINQAGNKTSHNNNLFQLTQVKNSIKADLALHGLGKESKTQAVASLGNGRLLALDESGEMRLHQIASGIRRDRQAPQSITKAGLPATQGLTGEAAKQAQLKDMAVNEHNKLFGLSGGGALFMLDSKEWQGNNGGGWQPITHLPASLGTLASLHTDGQGRLMVADSEGNAARLEAGSWQPIDKQQALETQQNNRSARTFDRLGDAGKSGRIPGTNVTYKREIDLFGSSGSDTSKVNSPFKKRMQAFVLRTSGGGWPRPMKNLGNEVKHRLQGREGLSSLYQAQNDIAMKITAQHTSLPQPQTALEQRLERLNIKGQDTVLHQEITDFAEELGHSLMLQSRAVGQHYGVLDDKNQLNTDAKKLKNTHNGHLNSARNRDTRMVSTLQRLIKNNPSAHTAPALQVINGMQMNHLTIDHLKHNTDKPVRDSSDELGLVKSRLFLDAMTQQDLHSALNIYQRSLQMGDDPATARAALQTRIRELRDQKWSGDPVKKLTDQGFANLHQVEANYDAIKKMTNAFAKPHHGLNVTSRTVFNAPSQTALVENLAQELKSLNNGESLTFNSNYGAFASSVVLPGAQVTNVVGGRANADRGYSLAFARGEDGLTVTVGRNGAGGFTPFTGVGHNMLTGHINPDNLAFGKDGNHRASPAVRLGMAASLNLQRQSQNSVTFSLPDNELNTFLNRLASDQIDPLDLLDKGNEHKVKNGSTWTASLDTSAAALASVGLPMTNSNEKNHIAQTRFGGGVAANLNIAAASRERNNNGNASTNKQTSSNNRVRFFNQGAAEARFMTPSGMVNQTAQARQPIMAVTGAGVRFSFDNRTKQALSLELTQPHRLAATHLDKLTESLGKAFTDRETAKLIDSLKDPAADSGKTAKTSDEKLDALLNHFGQHEAQGNVTNNAQYSAIRELVKLRQQREALNLRVPLPGGAETQSTYNNLAKIDSNGLLHWIGDMLSHETQSNHELSNANRIRGMMQQDAHLSGLIKQMQLSADTQAVVTLEPKDDVKEQLNTDWLAGRISRGELEARLKTHSNMRIKSVAFTESKSKSDGVSTPQFLLGGGSNVSVAKSRNLGKISFSYGRDQQSPLAYTLEGELAKRSTEQLAQPLQAAQQDGRVVKS
ncbi:MAG: AvrE-family type 3 secretion system effector [Pantoea sp.]|nr:AvrE-family type 3 secretion system effector [Pantoea sp.]